MIRPCRGRLATLNLVFALVALTWTAAARSESTIEGEIRRTHDRLEAAQQRSLHLIAPKSFGEAQERLEKANVRYKDGGKIDEIRSLLEDVDGNLTKAEGLQEMGNVILRDAMTARTDADKAKSAELAANGWSNGEKAMRAAGEKVESGDQNSARKEAAKAVTYYRESELLAIRTAILGSAWALRDQAKEQKAHERAAITVAGADDQLAKADAVLARDRYAKEDAAKEAARAADAYRHTLLICERVEKIEKDKKAAPEQMILEYEGQVARIAKAFGVEPQFAKGVAPVTERILAVAGEKSGQRENMASTLTKERDALSAQLAATQKKLEAEQVRVATLEGRDAVLVKKEQYDIRMAEVQAVFKGDEADVLRRGEELTIRMYGLAFPVGSAEIRPDNFALLSRIRQVLARFPNSSIAIEGHTDATGSDETNQALSQKRADAVREYLLATMSVDPGTVSAVGFGESRPIANNETADGRARNRRIDLRLD
ncbi:OmpA family protein, partial [bacterium]|nr:OmpA family protein [bacterium]